MTALYLIWSNKQNAWWGPEGRAYTQDLWDAGRFTLADAERLAAVRTWKPGTVPPEVVVQAPEAHMPLDTFELIEAAPIISRRLVDDVTRVAMREQRFEAVVR